MKRTEVLWKTQRGKVFEEIARLLGVPTADETTPGWFHKRMAALGNIIASMTEHEKAQLDDEVEKISTQGYSQEDKVRCVSGADRCISSFYHNCRCTAKYASKRFDAVASQHYLEMGLLSVSFVARPLKDGALSVEM